MRAITYRFSQSKTALLTGLTGVMLALSLLIAPAAEALTIGGPSDCDNNAIVKCGTHSTAAIQKAYRGDPYVQKVFASFGITNAEIANLQTTNVAGRVTRDGKVFVDGRSSPVATDAVTAGRQNIPGSTPVSTQGTTFYRRPPSVSFQQASLPSFVVMKDGQFQFAVIASCGNPVRAKAVAQPKVSLSQAQAVSKPPAKAAPKPAPAPPPQQSQSQSQQQSQSQSVKVENNNTTNVQNTTTQPQPTAQAVTEQPAAQQTAESQPGKLVDTGPTGVTAAFLTATVAGIIAFRRYLTRRLAAE